MQAWLVDKLVKDVGFPRQAVELVLSEPLGHGVAWTESGAVDVLTRRLCGWEDEEWGVQDVLSRLRSAGDTSLDELVPTRDERRAEELEALEAVFAERFLRSPNEPSTLSISIPSLAAPSPTASDDLTLHVLFPPGDFASSPYPSAIYPTSPPAFYLTSNTLPAYIRLHLQATLLKQFQDPDRADLRSTLEAGEGGISFALVECTLLALSLPPDLASK